MMDGIGGEEWIVDAYACDANSLRSSHVVMALLDTIVVELHLTTVSSPQVHVFPGPGGLTAFYLLMESHLACHTYPEDSFASFNLYCCRERPQWPWATQLREVLGATEVTVRRVARGRGSSAAS